MPIKLDVADGPLSLKQELQTWTDGVSAFGSGDFSTALGAFELIADSSKIHFNIGMILQRLQRYEDAVIAFAEATDCDGYLAVAYFQRGVCYYIMGAFESALEDFNVALAYLRGNNMIDYAQLGLDYKLYACEALYNRALCHFQLQNFLSANSDLQSASSSKSLPEHDQIDYALRNDCQDCRPFQVPEHLLYGPPRSKVENAKKKDYMGSSKVVAAVNEADSYTGFSGAKLRRGAKEDEDAPREYVSATLTRGLPPPRTAMTRSGSLSSLSRPNNMPSLPSSRNPSVTTLNRKPMNPSQPMTMQRRPSAPTALMGRTPPTMGGMAGGGVLGPINTGPMLNGGGNQDYGALSSTPTGESVMTLSRGDGIKIKAHCGEDTRLLILPHDTPYQTFLYRLQDKFRLPEESTLVIKYKDEDGEMIRVDDDEDWSVMTTSGARVEIWVDKQ